ncbi:probable inactive DNA (cytosine-5)-methyltransferase DRM3 isoform X2 [Magnolia sinica]|nr:probable inactive DNA (cytosine-5)-methyltransferase DRM3 isoform X2 [Magnolia sinica]XP_058077887.1 probable inactive DNA (cytosine-5)-methyltransferase DRM3 isoform X2 [Magnolia sinica]
MVDCADSEGSKDQEGKIAAMPKVEVLDWELSSEPVCTKPIEGSLASSSWSHLKSNFVGMGFSPALVEKVLEENGEEDFDMLLETLFTYSALQKSSSESSDFPDGIVSACKVEPENSSPIEFSACDSQEIEGLDESVEINADKKGSLLRMNFSVEEVELAISRHGEDASITELVDFIVAAQIAGSPGEKDTNDTLHSDNVKVITTETLFGTMDKTLRLLDMGFSGDEISSAIDKFGGDVPLLELADSIFANQIANTCVQEDNDSFEYKMKHRSWNENKKRHFPVKTEESESSSSNAIPRARDRDFNNMEKGKRVKPDPEDEKFNFFGTSRSEARGVKTETYGELREAEEIGPVKFEMRERPILNKNPHQLVGKPPYFFYGNVANISQESWRKISQFLHGAEPEYVNSQFFSAFIRKEGYVHNLPTSNRFHILPRPPMTIEDALPHTKKWWPSWDTRKQLSCISSETTGISQICERLGRMLVDSGGVLSKEQQMNILHQCKTLNLVWVGQYKLSPIEPDQVDRMLGYPSGHTQIGECPPAERLRSLKNSFQTDTLGYHLSPLKDIFPDGVSMLSLFSGIGGAAVALHKLGLRLKCIVSVEASRVNREIQKKWWQDTKQTGVLRLIDDIQGLSSQKIKSLIGQFGGFDIVFAGNPCTPVSGTPKITVDRENPAEVDFSLFYEFVRVWQRVRDAGGRN